jgi:hypothetical protein
MSVEIEGPQGYEFQYLVTASIAVKHVFGTSLVVESTDGEDAQLTVQEPTITKLIDMQIKSSNKDIDLATLCDWLAHFPSRKIEHPLIEKLIRDENRTVVFIAAGRCADSTRAFLRNFGDPQQLAELTTERVKLVIKAIKQFADQMPSKTKLESGRRDKIIALSDFAASNSAQFKKSLQRIIIWESTTVDYVNYTLAQELALCHYIPRLSCANVISQLVDAVRLARNTRTDVIPDVRKILSSMSGKSMQGNEPHDSIGREGTLLEILHNRRVLLLTGRSQCGKTNMAKYLAQRMQDEGVNAMIGQDVDETLRFLTARNEEERLYLLEDPFDHGETNRETIRAENILRRLLNELPAHRYLIVTSKITDLPPTARTIQPYEWLDLTIQDPDLLMNFWRNHCANTELLKSLDETLSTGLRTQQPNELPQPGHLLYLSRQSGLEGLSFDELCKHSRFDIVQLARVVADRSPVSRRIHAALCFGASSVQQIQTEVLAFILSDSDERPGFKDSPGIMYTFGPKSEEAIFPSIQLNLSLTTEEIHELNQLEAAGHIRATTYGYEFTHPDYLAASREVVRTWSNASLPTLLCMLERGMASVSEANVLVCTKSLRILFSRYVAEPHHAKMVFDVALKGTQSIFPAVRDALLQIMIGWLGDLDSENREKVLNMVRGKAKFSYRQVHWQGEQPWTGSHYSFKDAYFELVPGVDAKIEAFMAQLAQPQSKVVVSQKRAWELAHYLKANRDNPLSAVVLTEIMKQPYAFIRVKAVGLLVEKHIGDIDILLRQLDLEEDPGVLRVAVHAFFEQWINIDIEAQIKITQWLSNRLRTTVVAVSCSDLLTDFGDAYSDHSIVWAELLVPEQNDLWKLWAALFPVYLRTIALQPFEHNSPHMYNTLQVAQTHLGKTELVSVFKAWVEWIDGQLELRPLDDFELPVAELLMDVLEQGTERMEYVMRLLAHRDTGYVATSVKFLVQNWENLSVDERTELISVLQSQRFDVRWLRAVAITRETVPEAIQLALTGDAGMLSHAPDFIVNKMVADLLSDALHVHCGDPQPLWWYGLHHATSSPWQDILEVIAAQCKHREFQFVIKVMLEFVLNTSGHNWKDPLGTWCFACREGGYEVRNQLFKLLLRVSVLINNPQMFGFWETIYENSSNPQEADKYTNAIFDHLRAISCNVRDIEKFFGKNVFRSYFLPKMKQELKFIELCKRIETSSSGDANRIALLQLNQLLLKDPPRLFWLYDKIEPLLEGHNNLESETLRQTAKQARSDFIDKAHGTEMMIDDTPKITNWVTSCRTENV